jgi:excisionase family DNA binding protein
MRLRVEPLWTLSLYPDAGEGGGCLWVRRRVLLPSEGPPNAVRAAEEAGRRARAKIRRYAAANRLNRLGTLTYRGEGCHDPARLRGDLGGFFRGLRAGLGAGRFAYVWVPQWHPGGHGLHAHFAVGRFMPRTLIERSCLLTTREAADVLRVHPRTVQRLVERGQLDAIHLGAAVSFDPQDVADLTARLKRPASQVAAASVDVLRASRPGRLSFADRLRSQHHEHRARPA